MCLHQVSICSREKERKKKGSRVETVELPPDVYVLGFSVAVSLPAPTPEPVPEPAPRKELGPIVSVQVERGRYHVFRQSQPIMSVFVAFFSMTPPPPPPSSTRRFKVRHHRASNLPVQYGVDGKLGALSALRTLYRSISDPHMYGFNGQKFQVSIDTALSDEKSALHTSLTAPPRRLQCLQFYGESGIIYNPMTDDSAKLYLNAMFATAYISGVSADTDILVVTPYVAQGTWVKAAGIKVSDECSPSKPEPLVLPVIPLVECKTCP